MGGLLLWEDSQKVVGKASKEGKQSSSHVKSSLNGTMPDTKPALPSCHPTLAFRRTERTCWEVWVHGTALA